MTGSSMFTTLPNVNVNFRSNDSASSLQKTLIGVNATDEMFSGTFGVADSKALTGLLSLQNPKINDWGFDSLEAARFIERQPVPKLDPAITAFSALNGGFGGKSDLFSQWTGDHASDGLNYSFGGHQTTLSILKGGLDQTDRQMSDANKNIVAFLASIKSEKSDSTT